MIKEEIDLEKEEYTFDENYFVHHFSPCILYLIDSNVQEISWARNYYSIILHAF